MRSLGEIIALIDFFPRDAIWVARGRGGRGGGSGGTPARRARLGGLWRGGRSGASAAWSVRLAGGGGRWALREALCPGGGPERVESGCMFDQTSAMQQPFVHVNLES
jgi:hypothetical protein